mmetsp:Transcript_9222/g.13211  ORF Transcript_9222/g.13211 Transcript_9222/m.13211 type:complete len:81 (+) Transcript_9222:273-515(+)
MRDSSHSCPVREHIVLCVILSSLGCMMQRRGFSVGFRSRLEESSSRWPSVQLASNHHYLPCRQISNAFLLFSFGHFLKEL